MSGLRWPHPFSKVCGRMTVTLPMSCARRGTRHRKLLHVTRVWIVVNRRFIFTGWSRKVSRLIPVARPQIVVRLTRRLRPLHLSDSTTSRQWTGSQADRLLSKPRPLVQRWDQPPAFRQSWGCGRCRSRTQRSSLRALPKHWPGPECLESISSPAGTFPNCTRQRPVVCRPSRRGPASPTQKARRSRRTLGCGRQLVSWFPP